MCIEHLVCVRHGKKPWYHDKLPNYSEIDQKHAATLLPEGTRIWCARVRSEWDGQCPPFSAISSRWCMSTNEGAMKNVVKRLWVQTLYKAGLDYNDETCPHFAYLADAPPE